MAQHHLECFIAHHRLSYLKAINYTLIKRMWSLLEITIKIGGGRRVSSQRCIMCQTGLTCNTKLCWRFSDWCHHSLLRTSKKYLHRQEVLRGMSTFTAHLTEAWLRFLITKWCERPLSNLTVICSAECRTYIIYNYIYHIYISYIYIIYWGKSIKHINI